MSDNTPAQTRGENYQLMGARLIKRTGKTARIALRLRSTEDLAEDTYTAPLFKAIDGKGGVLENRTWGFVAFFDEAELTAIRYHLANEPSATGNLDPQHYETLDLEAGASQSEIKAAYRKLAAVHHPDKGRDAAAFTKVREAYESLKAA
ncbi:MAG: J domain-containing protein [Chromatiaceae bacterium]|nr:J domain-containing protein [Chromatiaceae bacterium]